MQRPGDAGFLGGSASKRSAESLACGDSGGGETFAGAGVSFTRNTESHVTSEKRDHNRYQPPHSKRRKQQRGIAPPQTPSLSSSAASPFRTSSGSLHLTLLDDDGMETVFRMGTSASFEQVVVAYAGLVGAQPHRVQLWHSGARIRNSQTPAEV